MEVFRITREKYSSELNGKGAALKGARWNSPGTEIIYTAGNRSLAMAEVAVHFSIGTLPDKYNLVTILIPDSIKIKVLKEADLPPNWNAFPYVQDTSKIGDNFIKENKYCVFKVPSAVTQGDFNYLINPHNKDFSKIKITGISPFAFDRRIFPIKEK